ncbi:MAG: HPr kinase/phosphatase C-terminal domain-containing protein [Alphaproteobacteria bacterium]|nr:HPr kinase/phosphatase C-terminal domain-containing protein [Alphaproteobacteria bacterium]
MLSSNHIRTSKESLSKIGMLLVHGTTVDVKGNGVLIRGKPGAGKSALALQLIDRGALLVADDQTLLGCEKGKLIARSPTTIRGMMEVREIGICSFPYQEQSTLSLCVEICEKDLSERLPEPAFIEYHAVKLPLLLLRRGDPLGSIKVELKTSQRDNFNAP